jgi:DNA mismatch repair ATPase MutS
MTPLYQQYQKIKSQYPDVILMFRLGDFYELFADDAKIASEKLQLVMTSREWVRGEKVPMCGVPYHASERYIARLIAEGHRVAVCEQMDQAGGIAAVDGVECITERVIVEPKKERKVATQATVDTEPKPARKRKPPKEKVAPHETTATEATMNSIHVEGTVELPKMQ